MDSVLIPCPKCRAVLRLRDRSLLGRTGRCSKCGHKLVLAEVVRTDPHPPIEDPAANALADHPPSLSDITETRPAEAKHFSSGTLDAPSSFEAFGEQMVDAAALKRPAVKPRRAGSRIVGLVVAMLIPAGLAAAYGVMTLVRTDNPTAAPSATIMPCVADADPAESRPEAAGDPFAESPTRGEPIALWGMPAGASVIINVHPAALCRPGSRGDELRRCLGPFGDWSFEKIRETCIAEPAEIDEAMICLIFGSPGQPPEIAAAVQLAEGRDSTAAAAAFGGEQSVAGGVAVFRNGERVLIVRDPQSYCVGPAAFSKEMLEALRLPATPVASLRELLGQTDRERLLTLVFDPRDAQRHIELIAPASVRGLMLTVCEWLDPAAVESAAWSLHLEEHLHAELLLRNRPAASDTIVTANQVRRDVAEKLDALPREMLHTVEQMQPAGAGRRQLVGRLPAMTKAFALSTRLRAEDRIVAMQTVLPVLAAPNLALAARLAWDEASR